MAPSFNQLYQAGYKDTAFSYAIAGSPKQPLKRRAYADYPDYPVRYRKD